MQTSTTTPFFKTTFGGVILVGLYLSSFQSYLLFHTLAELFSIVVAFGIFIIGWNSRDHIKSNYLLFLAVAYLFIGFLDLLHTMAYKGMGIFTDYDYYANQLWIATRYMESLSLLVAFLFLREERKFDPYAVFTGYFVVTAVVVASIFWWKVFPVCFVEGTGLTPFKKISEYIICLILASAIWLLIRRRDRFDPRVHRWLVWSLILTICSELAFTFYISNYGFSNLVGHYFKIFSFYFVYRALVVTGIIEPHAVLFRALHESESKFRALVESSRDIIWELDLDLRYTYVSPPARDILGYEPEEMLGKHPYDFMPPALGERTRERLNRLILTAAPVDNMELLFLDRSGEQVTLESRGVPILDAGGLVEGYRGVDRDVTWRKLRDRELQKMMRAMEGSPIGMVITSPAGYMEYVNLAFCEMKGVRAAEVVGQHIGRFVTSVHGDTPDPEQQEFLSDIVWQGDICNRNSQGEMVWEHVVIAPVPDRAGEPINHVATFEDITDRKDLEKLKEDVEQMMRHDLKSPLNGVTGLPELILAGGNLSEEQQRMVRMIESTGRRMLRMIDHSLDLFKMEMGTYVYEPSDVDPAEVLDAVLQGFNVISSSRDIRVTVHNEPGEQGASCMVRSDRDLLYNMFSNFIDNALAASPDGGEVVIRIEGVHCRTISISNSGAVPREIRDQFFEKYKTYGKRRGTGLGTYSSKLMADVMGYALSLETSDEQNATTILIRIPEDAVV